MRRTKVLNSKIAVHLRRPVSFLSSLSAAVHAFTLLPLPSALVYISWLDQRLSQDNHQLHKESRGGDSSLHHGCVQHLEPYGLGLDSVFG